VLSQKLIVKLCRARTALLDLGTDVTVASLARASRLSRSQFISRYRTVFGDTPHQTRIRARLERAQWLLATTNLPVTEICMAIGFSSLGTFSRMFRARCGEPPVRYRARLAKVPSPAALLTPHCSSLLTAAWSEPSYF
jgi:transcriptional regulator GlxA family with amidase domain